MGSAGNPAGFPLRGGLAPPVSAAPPWSSLRDKAYVCARRRSRQRTREEYSARRPAPGSVRRPAFIVEVDECRATRQPRLGLEQGLGIGRTSFREGVCQSVSVLVVGGSLKKKQKS